jgi:lipopolysaccharide export system protein LptA
MYRHIDTGNMRFIPYLTVFAIVAALAATVHAQTASKAPKNSADQGLPPPIEVTADQSLEWYQDARIYVARGNAKAIRGDLVVTADLLTAHERDKPAAAPGAAALPKTPKPAPDAKGQNADQGTGDIDKMIADGHVRIITSTQRVTGEHAVDDIDHHRMIVTGHNLRYETEKEIVTARDSLEYYDDTKIAVARGNAVADQPGKHVEGDVLTAEFRDGPEGSNQLTKMTALGNVSITTKTDVTRGDKGVYDKARDIALVTGHVRITRADGTQLTGDVGEVDFTNNQSRLLNSGKGRVRALLTPKATDQSANKTTDTKPAPANAATAVTASP